MEAYSIALHCIGIAKVRERVAVFLLAYFHELQCAMMEVGVLCVCVCALRAGFLLNSSITGSR